MVYLTERHDIAKVINFGKFPVLTIDLDNQPYSKTNYAVGCRVRVAWDDPDPHYDGMTTHGELYFENGKFAISGECAFLSESFGYSDVLRMASEANTPVVHRGDICIVVMYYSKKKIAAVRAMRIPHRISKHCQTVAVLEDINDQEELKL